jgi:putative transposase
LPEKSVKNRGQTPISSTWPRPVRAGIIDEPGGYSWSSYCANAEGRRDRIVTPHSDFLALGVDNETRRRTYRRLFTETLETAVVRAIRDATAGGYPLVSESFISKGSLPLGWRTERGRPGRPPSESDGEGSLEIGL